MTKRKKKRNIDGQTGQATQTGQTKQSAAGKAAISTADTGKAKSGREAAREAFVTTVTSGRATADMPFKEKLKKFVFKNDPNSVPVDPEHNRKLGGLFLFVGLMVALIIVIYAGYILFTRPYYMPQKWDLDETAGLTGAFEVNSTLDDASFLATDYRNSETIVYRDGYLWVSTDSGIVRMKPDGSKVKLMVKLNTGATGIAFDNDGNLLIAAPSHLSTGGAILIAKPDKKQKNYELDTYISEWDDGNEKGEPARFVFPNSICVADDGTVYFTDSCEVTPNRYQGNATLASQACSLIHQKNGKVFSYSPETGKTELVAEGLAFANGIALTKDQQSLLVSETLEHRIWKIDTSARGITVGDAGSSIVIDKLPGRPDNLSKDQNGNIWVGMVSPQTDLVEGHAQKRYKRKLVLNLPMPLLKRVLNGEDQLAHAFLMTEDGKVLEDLQGQTTDYTMITGVCDTGDTLFFESTSGQITEQDKIAYLTR